MGHTGPDIAEKSLGLQFSRFRVFAPALNVGRRPTVPGLERVGIVLAHLLFGRKAIRELVEHKVSVHGCDAANQDHEHPFHSCLRNMKFAPPCTKKAPVRGQWDASWRLSTETRSAAPGKTWQQLYGSEMFDRCAEREPFGPRLVCSQSASGRHAASAVHHALVSTPPTGRLRARHAGPQRAKRRRSTVGHICRTRQLRAVRRSHPIAEIQPSRPERVVLPAHHFFGRTSVNQPSLGTPENRLRAITLTLPMTSAR